MQRYIYVESTRKRFRLTRNQKLTSLKFLRARRFVLKLMALLNHWTNHLLVERFLFFFWGKQKFVTQKTKYQENLTIPNTFYRTSSDIVSRHFVSKYIEDKLSIYIYNFHKLRCCICEFGDGYNRIEKNIMLIFC